LTGDILKLKWILRFVKEPNDLNKNLLFVIVFYHHYPWNASALVQKIHIMSHIAVNSLTCLHEF